MKLTIVGGGSTYTPELVDGLVRMRDRLDVTEISLHDVSAERLDVLAGMSRRMLTAGGHPAVVTTHTVASPPSVGGRYGRAGQRESTAVSCATTPPRSAGKRSCAGSARRGTSRRPSSAPTCRSPSVRSGVTCKDSPTSGSRSWSTAVRSHPAA